MKKTILAFLMLMAVLATHAQYNYIPDSTIQSTCNDIMKNCKFSAQQVSRGISQAASLWMKEDGTAEEFKQFCLENFCRTSTDKETLFRRLCDHFEAIMGHNHAVEVQLTMPLHVVGYESLPIDAAFASYDGLSHFSDDMFANKIAFAVVMNFPHYTLKEKSDGCSRWTGLDWGYARLGDLFSSRVPADRTKALNRVTMESEKYISNYDICMGKVKANNGDQFWGSDVKLSAHWGLRDELKAAYADEANGLSKQQILYSIMKTIVLQTIPRDVINREEYFWYPVANKTYKGKIQFELPTENNVRYQHLLDNFHALRAVDSFYIGNPTYLERRFGDELEFFQQDVERLFTGFLAAPEVKTVANLISKKLGRKLRPFDIWYNGFKNRSAVRESDLDRITRSRYPSAQAFAADLPNILLALGFTQEKADFICQHVAVDPSIGAGHAWEAQMRGDKSRLRTRIGEDGMDYKGFSIGIHEFGHVVEETFSMHNVPNYFMSGVPNTAFTEAIAFTFQQHDLQLLGINAANSIDESYDLLDNFWGCYEICGVALVDIRIWKWMYAHPEATAAELRDAVVSIANEVWNQYYAPIFKEKDQPILAVYSHIIEAPLYLSAYPLGYLISFQLQNYFKGKNLGEEVERVFSQGRLLPQVWLQRAVGAKLGATGFVRAAANAALRIENYERQQAEAQKSEKKNKK